MSWSIPVGRLAGIRIYIHLTFFLLLAWFVSAQRSDGSNWTEVGQATVILLAAFFCIVLHELGHALTARQFGIQTKDIIVLPIGGVARLEKLPDKPWQELLVAIAGPITSAVIAFILAIGVLSIGLYEKYAAAPLLSTEEFWKYDFWVTLCAINVIFVLFNLVPAFPMDGGRVFRSVLSMIIGPIPSTKIASYLGQTIAFIFMVIGLYYSEWMFALVGAFIFLAARAELRETLRQNLFHGVQVRFCMFYNPPVLEAQTPVRQILTLFLSRDSSMYVVQNNQEFVGTLEPDDLAAAVRNQKTHLTVGDICTKPVHRVRKNMSVIQARDLLQEDNVNAFPVMENGRCIGLFTVNSLTRWTELIQSCQVSGTNLRLEAVQNDNQSEVPTNDSDESTASVPELASNPTAREAFHQQSESLPAIEGFNSADYSVRSYRLKKYYRSPDKTLRRQIARFGKTFRRKKR